MNKEKQKKKMSLNKKLLLFGVLPLCILIVSALTYYAIFSTTINFTQPIVTKELGQNTNFVGDNQTIFGNTITISNNGNTERIVVISNDNSDSNITVSYVGELNLTNKNLETWIPNWTSVVIKYTMVGKKFNVSGVPDGYTLVYYPDTGTYTGNVVLAKDVVINLPVGDDLNGNSLTSNYLTIKNSEGNLANPLETQAVGGKLWLIPNDAFLDTNTIDWSKASNFYFETELIQFNTEGNLVISPYSSITLTPRFDVDIYSPDITGLNIKTIVA